MPNFSAELQSIDPEQLTLQYPFIDDDGRLSYVDEQRFASQPVVVTNAPKFPTRYPWQDAYDLEKNPRAYYGIDLLYIDQLGWKKGSPAKVTNNHHEGITQLVRPVIEVILAAEQMVNPSVTERESWVFPYADIARRPATESLDSGVFHVHEDTLPLWLLQNQRPAAILLDDVDVERVQEGNYDTTKLWRPQEPELIRLTGATWHFIPPADRYPIVDPIRYAMKVEFYKKERDDAKKALIYKAATQQELLEKARAFDADGWEFIEADRQSEHQV